jgi:phosphatidate cytidylyltransferase
MRLPEQPWLLMLLVVWVVLLAGAVPLVLLSPVQRWRGRSVKSMWVKYAAWFVMVPAMTVPLLAGPRWMQIVFLAMSLYGFQEYSRAVGLSRERSHMWLARVLIVLIYVPIFIDWPGTFMVMPAFAILLILAYPIMRDTYQGMIQRSCLTILGVIYFGWFLGHLSLLLNGPEGRALVLAFFVVIVANDTGAYLIGSSIGRTPLSPNLSPNKTAEGVLGSLAVAMAMTFAVRFALGGISTGHTILLGFLLGVGGTCGDLAMSMIKRDVQIKDTGSLIPGHGGLLDRLDSVLFAAPIFVHFMNYFYGVVWQVPPATA